MNVTPEEGILNGQGGIGHSIFGSREVARDLQTTKKTSLHSTDNGSLTRLLQLWQVLVNDI